MSEPRRVALMFDLDGADHPTRQLARGIHRYAEEQAGRWLPILDPLALHHLGGRFDGLLAPGGEHIARQARESGVPYVGLTCSSLVRPFPRVVEHRYKAGGLAARHLMGQDYVHLAYLGFDNQNWSLRQEDGFRAGLRTRGHVASILLLSIRYREQADVGDRLGACLGQWLGRLDKPVGIFAARDVLARYLAQLCAEQGLRIPDDVGLVGAGNDPAVCLAPPVHLSSIDFAFERVGYRGAAYLDRLMDGHPRHKGNILIPPGLIARASTDREFLHHPTVADACRHIAARCHQPLRVADVAEAVGLSARQLVRLFQRTRSRTVVQEITHARLALAKDLLRTTDLTHHAIARGCGFGTGHRMARVFRQCEHTTPTVIRRAAARRPARDVHPLHHAKALLERTDRDLDLIARLCGFRSVYLLRKAFVQQEGLAPCEWRARHANTRPQQRPKRERVPDIIIHCDGEPRQDEATEEGTADEHR